MEKSQKGLFLSPGIPANPLPKRFLELLRPITFEELVAEMDQKMQFPGLQNSWTMPIRARIDMLSTGIRTPVGIKIAGSDLNTIQELGTHIEMILKDVPGTRSVYAERVAGGYFTDILIKREEIARYGLTVGDVQDVIQTALGGMTITRTVEGRERYSVSLRYPRELRDDVEKLERILVPISTGGTEGMGSRGSPGISGGTTSHVPLSPARRYRHDHGSRHDSGRERHAHRVCLSGRGGQRHRQLCDRGQTGRHGSTEAPGRIHPFLERSVRIQASRRGTSENPPSHRFLRDLCVALHDLSFRRWRHRLSCYR